MFYFLFPVDNKAALSPNVSVTFDRLSCIKSLIYGFDV